MKRNRTTQGWRKSSLEKLDKIAAVMETMRNYWPLTLRQIYYQLVAALIIANNLKEYRNLSALLSKARLQGLVPWEAMEDRSRSFLSSAGWSDMSNFITDERAGFLTGYRCDLLQSQNVGIEIVIEKDALAHIAHDVAWPYTVSVTSASGFMSMTFKNAMRKRILRRGRKPTKLLYFGDQDPSGMDMLPAMVHTLVEEMEISDQLLLPERVALNLDQIEKYSLPDSLDLDKDLGPIKPGDTRTKKYLEQFGRVAVELDALAPAVLEQIVRQSIEGNLDMSDFQRERDIETGEAERVAAMRAEVESFIEANF